MVKREIRVKVRGMWHTVEVEDPQRYPFQVTVDGEVIEVEVEVAQRQWDHSSDPGAPTTRESAGHVGLNAITQEDQKIIRSPMPGRIVSISVEVWDQVTTGRELCVLETMKMEQSIRISQQGIIRAVFIHSGQNVSVGEPLIQLE